MNDCHALRDILIRKYDFNKDYVYELYEEDATNLGIQNMFKQLVRSLTEQDNLIIYYSGHGGYDRTTEKGFWLPVDGDPINYTTWIPNETILSYIHQLRAFHVFLISDSCFSRTMIAPPSKSHFPDAKDYDEFQSRWILTSGAEETKDGDPGATSYFAEVLISVLAAAPKQLRVTTIIEGIKERFTSNQFQKPQGSTLPDPRHRAGEFIFRVASDVIGEMGELRGYRDVPKLLSLYKPNARFDIVGKHEDRSARIGYELYIEDDKVIKKVTYFLFLYEGVNQARTYEHLRMHAPEVFKDKILIIILPKERGQSNPERRLKNIQQIFFPLNIFYVDEFIKNQCTPQFDSLRPQGKYLELETFIVPPIENKSMDYAGPGSIVEWLKRSDEPILILKGEGGIGKTTFAQYIADEFATLKPDSFVLFLDSSEIAPSLKRGGRRTEGNDIYDFYRAQQNEEGAEGGLLTRDLFSLNLDAGNFMLVIDGLDEVISHVPHFNIESFMSSIVDSTDNLGIGKVIITCRSYFWDISEYKIKQVRTLELLPFDNERMEAFFQRNYPDNPRYLERAKAIAREFSIAESMTQQSYHPYVLDVICSIISKGEDLIKLETGFDSKVLNRTLKNDYIMYRLCYRETLRVNQVPVDEQIAFFLHLSVHRRGTVSSERLREELTLAVGREIESARAEAFKSHPFIKIGARSVGFRYDFFGDYFRGLYISNYFKPGVEAKLTQHLILMVAEYCWFGGGMIKDVAVRIGKWTQEEVLVCAILIDQLRDQSWEDRELLANCLAGIFNVAMTASTRYRGNSIDECTALLRALFSPKEDVIAGVVIQNVHNSEQLIRFNFSGLHVEDSIIENYPAFWSCTFDGLTLFHRCRFRGIGLDEQMVATIAKDQFVLCDTDESFDSAYELQKLAVADLDERIAAFLRSLLGLFYYRGRLQAQTYGKPHKGTEHHPPLDRKYGRIARTVALLSYEDAVALLQRIGVIELSRNFAERKVDVVTKHRVDILKYLKDGAMVPIVVELSTALKEQLKG